MKATGYHSCDICPLNGTSDVLAYAESFQFTGGLLRDDNDNTIATLDDSGDIIWYTPGGGEWTDIVFSEDDE